ncbi:MAG: cyclase family protein [Streptosporangiaceae bacterium]
MTEPAGTRPAGTGPAGPLRLTEAEFRALHARLRLAADRGADDRRGALNNITPAQVAAAAAEVTAGRSVSLAAPVGQRVAADNPDPARVAVTSPAIAEAEPGMAFNYDQFTMNVHGDHDSHLDALCHVSFDGRLYNGVRAGAVTTAGASELSVEVARDGITGRGVLLDIPRLRGVPWLEPGDHVTAADLAGAEQAQQVRVGQGDIVLVRVGHRRRRRELGAWDTAHGRAGLHPAALEFLAQRQIGTLGSDGNNDTAPSIVDGVDFPVHVLAINALGLHLLDYLQFDGLVPLCEQAGRWSFLCVIAPLRLSRGTGSPVNPIAIL